MFKDPFKDVRDAQIVILSLFLFLGVGNRDWTIRPDLVVVIVISCLVTQWLAAVLLPWCRALPRTYGPDLGALMTLPWRSAAITSLGLCLLLRTNHVPTAILAACLAIASKFAFRNHGKHFFNPANFGIVVALLLTSDAWVSPGQWGTDWWYGLLFVGAAGVVLGKVGRWDTSVAFLGTFAGLELARAQWLGYDWHVWTHQLGSGSLLLFAFFMLTDPRSIPDARVGRLAWAASIAGLTYVLQHWFFVAAAPFWALFAIAPLTPMFDEFWPAPRFRWSQLSSPTPIQAPLSELTLSDPNNTHCSDNHRKESWNASPASFARSGSRSPLS
ncbi:Na+-transporting NADH:ubiquinone oxidoreductase, subunit NqrB [Rubidibacter lacunae KORDI 51-2]|uniref:Na+-transporting NADH:ubiquinone oxidoreductase, subunit NqrB n=1 Tax=Rubidibacter lacunae KORDI 51-2 TaxID=582515 RepID=U5DP02_9CHRO|nr:RnfABCDGE type electron transport complex subunit D [Rubidibacter lacunae]ERN41435.1 Na+-transporting NADH:ubiquinone oxidoreductase, subunit NqrB [Rubidibacter lacunae KORDI 51-2]